MHSCKTTSNQTKTVLPSGDTIVSENILPEEKVIKKVAPPPPPPKKNLPKSNYLYTFLKNASSIKIFAYSIESADFATQLFREKLKGKIISILLSRRTSNTIRSKKRYFDQIGLPPILVNVPRVLREESFIIIDNSFVLKDAFSAVKNNVNPLVSASEINKESVRWHYCLVRPNLCYVAFKEVKPKKEVIQTKNSEIQKSSPERKTINFSLPSKTKLQIHNKNSSE